MRVALVLLAALVALTLAIAAPARIALEGPADPAVPRGWVPLADAPAPESRLRMQVFLRIRDADGLAAFVADVSNPKSARYGQYISLDELAARHGTPEADAARAEQWLESHGIAFERVVTRDILLIEPTVAQAEQLLQAKFVQYRHPASGTVLAKTVSYTVPTELASIVVAVNGAIGLPTIHRSRAVPTDADSDLAITPEILRERYNVTVVGTNPNNTMAVAEFQGQYYSPSDLHKFQAKYPTGTPAAVTVVGTNNPNAPGTEAALDIEYIMGVAPQIPTTFYSDPSMDFFTALGGWAAWLTNSTTIPLLHSVSYGDQTFFQPSATIQQRLDGEFQKAGARGLTLIFASGDSGSGCDLCLWLMPSFPATSPNVVSVGATQFLQDAVGPEGSVQGFSSGGGFSWVFPQPTWQAAAVDHYLTNYSSSLPFGFEYNAKGRATPDISALGWNFQVLLSGQWQGVGGTSAAAPTAAGILALVNDARLNAGQAPLGFAAPWLYQVQATVPGAIWDVTVGGDPDACCYFPFPAEAGFDACTGLGTLNLEALLTTI